MKVKQKAFYQKHKERLIKKVLVKRQLSKAVPQPL